MKAIRWCFFVIAVLSLALLASCGNNRAKSESDIRADIQHEDDYFEDFDLKFDEFNIVKRQTNPDDKTDYVWLNFIASNDDFIYGREYMLTYVLYNDGWLLEDIEAGRPDVTPKTYPTEQDAVAVMRQFGEDFTLIDKQKDDDKVTFSYSLREYRYYLYIDYTVTLEYGFGPRSGWECVASRKEHGYTLDIEGEWFYEDAARSYYINVLDVSGDTVTFEYRFEYTPSPDVFESFSTAKNSPITTSIGGPSKNGDCYQFWFDKSDIWIYAGADNCSLTNSSGCGLAYEGFFLTRGEAPTRDSFNTLVVATNAAYVPYEYMDNNGELVGIDVDIITAVAERLNCSVRIDDMPFDQVVWAVESGIADVAISGITATSEWLEQVNFSQGYVSNQQLVLVAGGSTVSHVSDLVNSTNSFAVGTLANTTGHWMALCGILDADIGSATWYDDYNELIHALKSGEVDCAIVDAKLAYDIVNMEKSLRVLDGQYLNEEYVIAVSKDNPELLESINQVLTELIADGTIQKIVDEYVYLRIS